MATTPATDAKTPTATDVKTASRREAMFPTPFLTVRPRPKIGDIVQRAFLDEHTRKPIIQQRMVIGLDPDDGSGRWRAYVADRTGQGVMSFTSDGREGARFDLRLNDFVPMGYEPFTLPKQSEPSHWRLEGHDWDGFEGKFVAKKSS